MIVFFGPAGAGKSVQGQILAARFGWRWLSAGQLLRDSKDIEVLKQMRTGNLVTTETVNRLVGEALNRACDIPNVILDGFPRELSQAIWLTDEASIKCHRDVKLIISLEVPRAELHNRLKIRGRVDDLPEVIDKRIAIYQKEIYPVLSHFADRGAKITHIDGVGTVGQVHDRIVEELEACKII